VDQRNRRIKLPARKISETFLDFADPLLEPLGRGATVDQMEQALKIAFTVWNGVVYDKVNGNSHHLDMARKLTCHVGRDRSKGLWYANTSSVYDH
jgi:hypothetical protein